MLAAPDQLLVRNDPALPGLPLLLDAEAFAEVLRPHVGALDAAEAVYVRYKPGENALVAYRLYMGGAAHWAYAKSHRHGATTKLTKATTRTTAATPLGPGHLVLPAWATVVSFFPNDAKLKALRRLGNPAARRGLIEKLLPERPDLLDLEPVLLRYKPERRYVARLGDVALKLHSPSGFAGAIQGRAGARSREAFQTPRVVGRSKRHRALAYAWIDGAVLADAIRAEGFDPRAVVPVGAALATLHAQPLDATWAPSDPSESLRAAAEAVGATTPTLAIRAEALAARLSTRLASPEPIALVHGDFYAKQVLLSPTTPTVLDLDRLMLGDPAADLGMFLAHLERDRLRFGLAPSRIDAVRADLLAGYAAVAEPLPDASVALHTAAAILQLAPHPFRFREPDWPARTAALLDTAEAYLDEGLRLYQPRASVSAQRPATVFDPEDAASDPKLPTLGHALDPVQATSALRALIHPSEGKRESLKLMSVRVVRHRPGRRALLEYRFEGPEEPVTLLGKVRAKGLDRSTFALMASLWQSGFGSSATDRVSVPEPVGVWPEARMWLQRRVPGISAATALAGPEGVHVARRTARALVKLHRGGPPPARRHTLTDELAHLHDRLPMAAAHHPALAPRIDRVLAACARLAASLPPARLRPLHRDFYPDNVLVAGTRIYLLDLDLYALGDPALDAGNFVAHLIEQGLRTHGDPSALAGPALAFEDMFVRLTGLQSRLAVWAYASLSLARHLFISTRIPERRSLTPALLDLCEQRLLGASVMPQPAEV